MSGVQLVQILVGNDLSFDLLTMVSVADRPAAEGC